MKSVEEEAMGRKEGREETINEIGMAPKMEEEKVRTVEEMLSYTFRNKDLVEALTHSSFYLPYKPVMSYERLEFIGDAVLNCIMQGRCSPRTQGLSPSPFTRLHAANIDTVKLAGVSVENGLHRYLCNKGKYLCSLMSSILRSDFVEVWQKEMARTWLRPDGGGGGGNRFLLGEGKGGERG